MSARCGPLVAFEDLSAMSTCKACGYHKNDPGQPTCNLCGAKLGGGGAAAPSAARDDAMMGVDRSRERGARRKVETKRDGPTPDQIVYAGDFAIVYVLAPSAGGSLVILKPGEVFTFGRGDAVDLKIDSKVVSRRHARIHWTGDPPSPEIVDLDSKNGITVNGLPIKRRMLEDGDELSIGGFSAVLRVLNASADLEAQLTVDRLSGTAATAQRLWGEVKLISLPWLLEHLERVKESGTLTVQDGDQSGYVALISGVAIAAAFGREGEVTGAEAIRRLAQVRGGRFSFSPGADVPPQAINQTISEVLGGGDAGPRPAGPPPGARRRPPPPPRRGGGPPPQRPRPR